MKFLALALLLIAIPSIYSSFIVPGTEVPIHPDGRNYHIKLELPTTDGKSILEPFQIYLQTPFTMVSNGKCRQYSNYQAEKIKMKNDKVQFLASTQLPRAYVQGGWNYMDFKFEDSRPAFEKNLKVLVPVKTCCCTDEVVPPLINTTGKIGFLGLSSGESNDLINSSSVKAFGISIPDEANPELANAKGKLIFNPPTGINSSIPDQIMIRGTNNDWILHQFKEVNFGKSSRSIENFYSSLDIAFDLTYPYIGVPSKAYNQTMIIFKENGLICEEPTINDTATCTYFGDISSLPNILFSNHNYSQWNFAIEPQVYIDMLHYQKTKQIKLNLKSTRPPPYKNPEGFTYDMIMGFYENVVILGAPYFQQHFIVFNVNETRVEIYKPLPVELQNTLPGKNSTPSFLEA